MTLQDEELERELRRELIVLLHVNEGEYARLSDVDFEEALQGLREVRGSLIAVTNEHAALKISVPPLLPSSRLREVLQAGLKEGLGREAAVSIRLLPELADTVEAAKELTEDGPEEGTWILCFTDEMAAGEPSLPLSRLREFLNDRVRGDLRTAFPVNHYDVLCIWQGPTNHVVWGPDEVISRAYSELAGVPVGSTARSLEASGRLVARFHA